MRRPAQEKGQDGGGEHAQHLVIPGTGALLNGPCAQQGPPDEAVTGDDDDERDQEAEQAFHQAHGQQQLLQTLVVVVQTAAHRPVQVADVVHVPRQRRGQAERKGKKPDGHAGNARVDHRAEPPRLHRVNDGEVAVDAERHQEKYAGVEVEDHQAGTGLAQELTKGPVVAFGGGGGPHGQGDEEGEIRNGQIEHKNVGHRFQLHVAVDDSHHHAVPHDADDKDAAVDDGHQNIDYFMVPRHAARQLYLFVLSCCCVLHFLRL